MTTGVNSSRTIASRGLRMLALAVTTLVMVLLGTSTAAATFPGGNGPIVFSSDRDGSRDIYKMAPNGGSLVQLTADSGLGDSGTNTDPVWSQDRTTIAFISNRDGNPDIWTMNADGNAETRITDTSATESDLSFNPDGTKLVYSSNADGDRELYTIDLTTLGDEDGPTIVKLTNNNFEDYNADWSPTGDRIVFERQAGGVSPGRGYQIFSISPEGGPETDLSQTTSVIENGNPSFNGNGTRIVFQRRATSTANWEIYTMNANGTVQTKRTNTPTFQNTAPVFSPSGTNGGLDTEGEKIAFLSNRGGGSQIYTMNANGSSVTKISDGLGNDTDQNWQALDIFPPQTEITVGPDEGQVLTVNNAGFEFTSTEEGSTFQCRLDPESGPGSWAACDTPFNTGGQDDGIYVFNVRAVDPSGNIDPSPATRGFVLDTTVPEVNLTDGPRGPWDGAFINFTDPTIEFTSPENNEDNVITFGCRLDPVGDDPGTEDVDETTPWSDCSDGTFELSDLSEGDHTIQVRGTDPWGNTSEPVEATFTVDLTLPTSSITSGPAEGLWSNDNTPTYEFEADEPGTFECRVTDSPQSGWDECESPFTPSAGLEDGPHTFQVRVTDRALNVQEPVTERLINVDTTPPVTTITDRPDDVISVDKATYAFESDQPEDATFECKVDTGAWESCVSPFTTGILDNGDHSFAVRSTDRADNLGEPAEDEVTVHAPPRSVFTSGPADGGFIPTGNASFAFESEGTEPSESTPTFECRVDSSDEGDWEACASPLNVTGLNNGEHKVEVRAVGQYGTDLTPAIVNFTVDKVRPTTTIESGPAEGSLTNDPTFVFGSNEPGTFQCEINGGGWEACASNVPLVAPDGDVALRVRAVDRAGNEDLSPVTRNFTLDATAPETTIDSGPFDGSRTKIKDPTFAFSSSEPDDATFECKVDGGEWEACDSGEFTTEALSDGSHTFRVRAIDKAGNVDPNGDSSTFTVDTVKPVATISTVNPAEGAPTNGTEPAFDFTSDKAASVFECRFLEGDDDSATWEVCATGVQPSAPLTDGEWTFQVNAIDDVGNVSETPASRSFVVDTTAPTTEITVGPEEGSTIDTGSTFFEFASSEEGSSFECSFEATGDPDDFGDCSNPFSKSELADGLYTFKVRATDPAGNLDTVGDLRNFEVDSPPNTSILPGSDVQDGGRTKKTTPSFAFESNENDATFECRVDSGDGDAWAACTSPYATSFLGDGDHTFEVRAVDTQSRPDLTPAKVSFTVDTVLPVTTFTSGPANGDSINDATPTFGFESSKESSTFECAVDGGGFSACSSPATIGPLSEGSHTFAIKAIDDVTNEESPAKEVTFTVDLTEPVTTITSPTEGESFNTNQPVFSFSADEDATFECQIDGGDWVECESPLETDELADGAHTFGVRATDLAGNIESPVTRNFSTEAPPTVKFTSGLDEDAISNVTTQEFAFEASEPDATFECRLDSSAPGDWSVCTSPVSYTGLGEGTHTVEVRALAFDPPHDPSLKPAKRTFKIDTVKPTTQITSGPNDESTITSTSTSFAFSSNDGGISFECRVDSTDAGDWDTCTSPVSLSSLAEGAHAFEVRATDLAGNVQDPVSRVGFSVDTTAPVTTITAGPEAGSTITDSTPTFEFTSDSAGTFDCKVDGGSFNSCTSPFTTGALSDGSHTVTIRATDSHGLVEATPPSRTFTVDGTAPNVNITSGPNGLTNDKTPTFAFTANEASTFECKVDGGSFATCASPFTTADLTDGAHTFSVRATDAAGNVSSPANRSFTVDATAPVVTITKAPAPGVGETSASVEFNASKNGVSFECALDGAAFAACTSPHSINGLAVGAHSIQVRATDEAGNQGAAVSSAFEVKAKEPELTPAKFGKMVVKVAPKQPKAGKKMLVTAKVSNIGETATGSVKVCVSTPKKAIKGKASRCKSLRNVAGGGTATVKFSLALKKTAKAGTKIKGAVTASAAGVAKSVGKYSAKTGKSGSAR
ncbi:MAG TPA: Ig-like domain-containing protein [Solirubrobacterales bacterium]|nr:Ig-like domain-containing protein [Solirubrobacterales bacterium]